MTTIVLNALALLVTILLAFAVKSWGILRQEDGQTVAKIVVWVTLPATLIVGVNGFHLSAEVFALLGLGVLCNVLAMGLGYVVSGRETSARRGLYLFNVGGYNIGNFTIPFVSSFFPVAIPFLAMFDMGNSLMVTGTTQGLVEGILGKRQQGLDFRVIGRILLKSPPFLTYMGMLVLAAVGVKLPSQVLVPVRFLASGNSFLSLFMIGLFMQFELRKLKAVWGILLARYAGAAVLSALCYFLLPFPSFVREVLVLVLFCPISFLTTIQAVQFGADEGEAGLASSLSMLLSLLFMSGIVMLFGLRT
ncbi:MAG: AEC family transporter [Streptococcaceae bacterium]|jgi:predicted permease|nr:AEC family transporter [Streptococcaceae bacterium]